MAKMKGEGSGPLNELLRNLFGGGLPDQTADRWKKEEDAQKQVDNLRKEISNRNQQQLIEVIKRQYSSQAAPLVLEAINKSSDKDFANSLLGDDPKALKLRAKIENQIESIYGLDTPEVIDADKSEKEARRRAKAQNKLNALLGREDEALPVYPRRDKSLVPNGVKSGIGADTLAPLFESQGSLTNDPRKKTALSTMTNAVRVAGGDVTAIPQLLTDITKMAHEKVEAIKNDMTQTIEGASTALTSQKAGKIYGGVFGTQLEGMGKLLEEGGVPGGGLLKEVGKFNKELGDSIEKVREWGKNLHESNLEFAQYSGGMAAVGARQMVRDILLSQERGNRRAATAEFQAEGKHELEKAFAPFEDLFANVQNITAGRVERGMSKIVNRLGDLFNVKNLNQYLGNLVGGNPDNLVMNWMKKEADRDMDFSKYGRPRRHQKPAPP